MSDKHVRHSEEVMRAALQAIHWTALAHPERDADLILSAAIDELVALRELFAALKTVIACAQMTTDETLRAKFASAAERLLCSPLVTTPEGNVSPERNDENSAETSAKGSSTS